MFQPPEPFDSKYPELWEKWFKRFERYRIASGLDNEPQVKQVSCLIYCMGPDSEDILSTAHLSEDDKASYESVTEAFDNIFTGKRNVIYERAKFNSRSQQPDELFDTFLADISSMAEHCSFKNLKAELIRDRIVVGITDKRLSAQLQEDSNLTLEEAVQKCKQKESISKQAAELEMICQGKHAEVDRIKSDQKQSARFNKTHDLKTARKECCWNCGGPMHPRHLCPAKDLTCHYCQKIGHFAKHCRSRLLETKTTDNTKRLNEIGRLDKPDNTEASVAYLGPVNASCYDSSSWYVEIFINNQLVKAKLDSGAEVTAIPSNVIHAKLMKSDRILRNADQRELDVRGMFIADIAYDGKMVKEKVYVVAGLNEPLLGIPAIKSLNLITLRKADTAGLNSITLDSVLTSHPELFIGLGSIPGEYKIELNENAQPHSVRAPRNISIPLRSKVETELNRMLDLGVIEKVESPTDWCAPIVPFLGNLIDCDGIKVDPDRIRALEELPPPKDIAGVRRLNGMLNQLNKFIPNLADKTESFRELTRKNRQFCWTSQHQEALSDIIQTVNESISLTKYDVNAESIVIADSSAYGLGAMLLQVEDKSPKVVMFASRTLQDCERRYAQIEKEALACAWAAEKFSKFLVGKKFRILTDHKPLVSLLGSKDLDTIPARIQRFKMRLMKFDYSIEHIPGKEMFTADTLSRAPIPDSTDEFTKEVEAHIKVISLNFPATQSRLEQIKNAQILCEECQMLVKYTENGWPKYKKDVPESMRKWYTFKDDLSIIEDLICYKERIIIPFELRKDIINKLHDGHFGSTRTVLRAKQSVFWPGITTEINNLIENCDTCAKHQNQKSEKMIQSDTPDYPWQRIAVDYFDFVKGKYLAVVDYYSRYLEMINVSTMTVDELIKKMKACFARHGIPEIVISDSGSQFTSSEWRAFAADFGFKTICCSPLHHQANGEAERAVQTLKKMLTKNKDPTLALLEYRSTPGPSGYSPSELLMGRRLRTRLPSLTKDLKPKMVDHKTFRELDKLYRATQADYFNKRHGVRDEKQFTIGCNVYIPDRREDGKIVNKVAPRSYTVKTNEGMLRRNGVMLRQLQPKTSDDPGTEPNCFSSFAINVATLALPLSQLVPVVNPQLADKLCHSQNVNTRSWRREEVPG
ncbi:uncharacterized protein K02A2.6-like [Macrosteles quadrilineatus]|uniref:uncharacterized protein K02A2.6-like n=1 Tax=Macrosteles quadrilineatus TaxID=74068 RepID=UPI0023E17610|nr:uncharacterized protein K02A2.6-like [Macrosteles quadrilineatus]